MPERPAPQLDTATALAWLAHRARHTPIVWWVMVAVLAGGSAVVLERSADRAQSARHGWGTMVTVPVATRSVPAGALLGPDDVTLAELPGAVVPDAEPAAEWVGRRTGVALAPGEVVLASRLAGHDVGAVAALLRDGEVAVGVPEAGTGLALSPGDVVSVMVTLDVVDADGVPTWVVTTRGRVLAVDEVGATVAVPDDVAPKVAHGVVAGVVTLALRR